MEQQILMRSDVLDSSVRRASHRVRTSGRENSCDNIRLSHLRLGVRGLKIYNTSPTNLKAKYCILIPCLANCFSTSGSTSLILVLSRTIMAWIPVEESSRVLMKKSLMSDIKFVKQKKQSASA